MQRHPQLSVRMPEAIQLARARCCTPEALQVWYSDFDQFSMIHNVKKQPLKIWNADEVRLVKSWLCAIQRMFTV